MQSIGFEIGKSSACLLHHKEKNLLCSVHGDDFTTVGPHDSLEWFKERLSSKYELKEGARLGSGPNDDKEGRVLNRIVRWTPEGIMYEADPRHKEKLIQELSMEESSLLTTW